MLNSSYLVLCLPVPECLCVTEEASWFIRLSKNWLIRQHRRACHRSRATHPCWSYRRCCCRKAQRTKRFWPLLHACPLLSGGQHHFWRVTWPRLYQRSHYRLCPAVWRLNLPFQELSFLPRFTRPTCHRLGHSLQSNCRHRTHKLLPFLFKLFLLMIRRIQYKDKLLFKIYRNI